MMKGYRETSGLADEEGIITAIPKNKAEDLLGGIINGTDRDREEVYHHRQEQPQPQQQLSIADELMKLANLKEKGIISEDRFHQMEQDLIKKKR
jgi:hypothetical protein